MKRSLALVLTAVAIGGSLLLSQRAPRSSAAPSMAPKESAMSSASLSAQPSVDNSDGSVGPESVVWTMTDAWRAGDVRKYLDCFADPLRARLLRAMAEMGDAKFAEFLQATNREVVGLAISGATSSARDSAEVPLEFIYRGKNETQTHLLRRVGGAWRIVDTRGATRIPTLIPYGTEVTTTGK